MDIEILEKDVSKRKIAGVGSIGRNINVAHIVDTFGDCNPRRLFSYSGASDTPLSPAMKSESIGT